MTKDPAETPQIIKVSEGFYVRQAVDNIAWIDMGDHAIVVDALEEAQLEREVFDAIESTLGDKRVKYVLNTHTHYDHTALNAAFQKHFGAEIVNQRTRPLPDEGRWFEGVRKVHFFPTPHCHTSEDACLWSPDDSALFVGDIFGWGLIPLSSGLNDRTAKLLEDTYGRLIEFDAGTVVPGHGPICTSGELTRWVEYFRWLRERVSQGIAEGKSDGQIASETAPPDDMIGWWRFVQWKHEDSLSKVIRAVRSGSLTI